MPSMIARSATLKIPVRTGPIPTLTKSTTRPACSHRSIQLPRPPPMISASASRTERGSVGAVRAK